MTEENKELKLNAEYYRELLQSGVVTIELAKENIIPYLNKLNDLAKTKAKQYNLKPRTVAFSSYVR